MRTTDKTIHLVLTHYWYDKIAAGQKRTEYRKKSPQWMKRIWECPKEITHVRSILDHAPTTDGPTNT